MKVTLVAKTQGVGEFKDASIDELIAGMARVSTDKKGMDMFKGPEGLIRYMLVNSHWSPFEMADLTFEIETSMPIAEQYIRHKSCAIQKFSGRYSELTETEPIEWRMAAKTNRQSSTDVIVDINKNWGLLLDSDTERLQAQVSAFYKSLLASGVAKECARMILPMTSKTRMYMKGNLRSWITLLNVRLDGHAQKEARLIAQKIRDVFMEQCPIISKALYNFEGAEDMQILDRLVLEKYGVYSLYKSL